MTSALMPDVRDGQRGPDGWRLADPYPMGARGRASLRGLIRAICPPEPAPQLPDLEDRIELQARRLMNYMPRLVAFGLRLTIRVLDQTPRLLLTNRRLLHALAPADAREILGRLSSSALAPVREIVAAVRGVILSIYFDQEEVHAALGYAPQPFMIARRALRNRILSGAAAEPADVIEVTPGLSAEMPSTSGEVRR